MLRSRENGRQLTSSRSELGSGNVGAITPTHPGVVAHEFCKAHSMDHLGRGGVIRNSVRIRRIASCVRFEHRFHVLDAVAAGVCT